MRIDSSGLIGKVLKENRFISKEVDLSSSIAEVAFIFDVANSNPNGSLPENMPRQIMSTGQIYATQESIKKRAKDLMRRVFEEKGLYEEKPEGKMTDKLTLWVSGRPVTADGRFKEIVGEFNNEIKEISYGIFSIRCHRCSEFWRGFTDTGYEHEHYGTSPNS